MVGRGYHIALTREAAKQLFAQQDDDNLRSFLDELKTSPEMKKSDRVLETPGPIWDALHRCLTEGELDIAAGEFPLNHAVLGGRQLHKGDDYAAVLVRRDMCAFIAEALGEVQEVELRKKFMALNPQSYQALRTEKEFTQLWLALQNLKVFYDAAAENLDAIVFTAKYRE